MPPYTFFVPFQVTARVKKSKTAKGKDDIDIKNIQANSIIPGNFFINNAVKDVSLWPSANHKVNSLLNMSHFAYACKMRCPLNLVLENSEYLWYY